MLEAGIIAQTRHSSWCSNLVVARKKNGKIRICIDFRNLNIACTKDCRKSRSYQQSSWSVFDQAKTLSFLLS
jgi:hypothetical protein